MESFRLALQESYNELVHNVSWPSREDLLGTTVVVLVASAIITLIIFGMDMFAKTVFLDLLQGAGDAASETAQ